MTFGTMLLAVIGILVTGCGAAIIWLLVEAHRDRWQFNAHDAAALRMIEVNRARSPRHAAGMPRKTAAGKLPDRPGRDLPLGGYRPAPVIPRTPHYVTAADLRTPVIVPEPGPAPLMRPQPARDSGSGTGMIPALTDTGELRALIDAWIHMVRHREEQHRREMRA